jgi:hypothetical protein
MEDAINPVFWRALCPMLSLEGAGSPPPVALPDLAALRHDILTEGYVNEPGVFSAEFVTRLREAVLALQVRGLPPVFIYLFDEPWLMYRALAPFLQDILDENYAIIPAFWAWCVKPDDSASGWRPHRDRVDTLDAAGRPESLTIWLPLSDATPLNGCIYVLPAQHDAALKAREFGTFAPFGPDQAQNIRALPAPAGSLLAWNQVLLHWGARASRRGKAPRCSLAVEFQRGDRPPFARNVIPPHQPLNFAARLGLIARQLRSYERWENLAPDLKLLAVMLEMKFGRA